MTHRTGRLGGIMLDRTIPFYNTILRCDKYTFQPITLPDAYRIISYQPGFEQDWARLEYSAGDLAAKKRPQNTFRANTFPAMAAPMTCFSLWIKPERSLVRVSPGQMTEMDIPSIPSIG